MFGDFLSSEKINFQRYVMYSYQTKIYRNSRYKSHNYDNRTYVYYFYFKPTVLIKSYLF